MWKSCNTDGKIRLQGYLFALGATALWSGNFVLARGINQEIPPVSLAFFRWLTAVLFFLPFALKSVLRERGAIREHLPYLSLVSFFGVSCFNTFIYVASHTTSAMNLALISITFPVFILIISRFRYGRLLTPRKISGMLLVLTGVLALLCKGDLSILINTSFVAGDLWVLAAAVLFSAYSILLKERPRGLGVISIQFTTFFLGVLFLVPFFIWEQTRVVQPYLSFRVVGSFLYMGIFASLFAFVFWNKAVELVGPDRAGMIYYMLPLFCGAQGHFFLNEPMGWVHLVSLGLIVGGIVMTNQDDRRDVGDAGSDTEPRVSSHH
ncbi:MAG: DMT family transporter [Desulfobacterales bacterium]|nr:DMT family transporter [Desulfobacterales bacterium]